MSEFYCGKCGKTFYKKSHADAHQRRKTPCDKLSDNKKIVPAIPSSTAPSAPASSQTSL